MMKIMLGLPWIFFFWSCRSAQNDTQSKVLASLVRTPCFGTCPAYQVIIYQNGQATYEGQANVEMMGVYSTKLSKKELEKIRALFEGYKIFTFKDHYQSSRSDLPTTVLHYSDEKQSKDITDYDKAPPELRELEREFAKLIDSYSWKKASQ